MNKVFQKLSIFENLFFIVFFLFIVCLYRDFLKSPDIFCSINFGKEIFTSIYPFSSVNPNWLSDLLLYCFYSIGGFNLLVIIAIIICFFICLFLFKDCTKRNTSLSVNIFLLIIGLCSFLEHFTISNRIFSFILFLLLIYALEYSNHKKNNISCYAKFFVIFVIWSNLNADFLIGLLLLSLYIVANFLFHEKDNFMELLYLLAISLLATFFTPYGIRLYAFLFDFWMSGIYKFYPYFVSPDFHLFAYKPLEIIILLLFIVVLFSTKRFVFVSFHRLFSSLIFMILSLIYAINIPFFVILVLPILAAIIESVFNNSCPQNRLITKIYRIGSGFKVFKKKSSYIYCVVILFISILFNFMIDTSSFMIEVYPGSVVKFLKDKKTSDNQILQVYGWGCYLKQQGCSDVLLTESFHDNKREDLQKISSIFNIVPDYQKLIDDLNISYIVLPQNSLLGVVLERTSIWQKIFINQKTIVFKKI